MIGHTLSYGAGYLDAYLVRVDDNGNMLWNKTYGGPDDDLGISIAELSNGFIISGTSNSYTASYDAWLVRTDLNGNHLWNVTYGGDQGDWGGQVVACADGSFTFLGTTSSFAVGNSDFWLVHTDASGNHQWNESFGGAAIDNGENLIMCTGGGYALTGLTASSGAGNHDVWLIRTDATGNHQWNQTYGGTEWDYGYSLIECSSGGFAIAGKTDSYGTDGDAVWLIRTDASGNHQWNQTYDEPGSDIARDLIEYSEGGFALAGYSSQEASLSRGPHKLTFYDGLLIRTDATGTMLWNRSYGGSEDDRYHDLMETSSGDLLTAGETDSFDISLGDCWLVKTGYPLAWNPAPTDQTVLSGTALTYDLNVSNHFPIDTWTINDTTQFAITTNGIVSSASTLPIGTYGIQVQVNDTMGSEVSGEFTVTVEAPIISPLPLELIFMVAAIIIVVVVILFLLYLFMLRKRK
jgi:hypothetical protein